MSENSVLIHTNKRNSCTFREYAQTDLQLLQQMTNC